MIWKGHNLLFQTLNRHLEEWEKLFGDRAVGGPNWWKGTWIKMEHCHLLAGVALREPVKKCHQHPEITQHVAFKLNTTSYRVDMIERRRLRRNERERSWDISYVLADKVATIRHDELQLRHFLWEVEEFWNIIDFPWVRKFMRFHTSFQDDMWHWVSLTRFN